VTTQTINHHFLPQTLTLGFFYKLVRCIFISFLFFFIVTPSKAQKEKRDSTFLYQKIEKFCSKRKVTKMLYKSIFRFSTPTPPPPAVSGNKKKRVKAPAKPLHDSNRSFEGKVIRSIHIITYDPFGYDSRDTSVIPSEFFLHAGNVLHIKTMPAVIRNIIIVKKFDTFDSLRIRESERLIRNQNYVREAFISPVLKNDSIDLYIRVYDSWSKIVTEVATPSSFTINVVEKNILGTGHQFQNNFKQNYVTGQNLYTSNYYIPNILNTHISSSIHYNIDESKNYNESFSLNRPFYSIFTSWAGGISFQQQLARVTLIGLDSLPFKQTIKSNTQDLWLGRSWQILKGHSEDQRTTSLISSVRYLRTYFVDKPQGNFDTLHQYPNQEFYLSSIGLSKRQYKQDKYIFRYGATEDIPIGHSYSIIGGYQIKDKIYRWYIGSRAYISNYYKFGYFNLYLEYGTFVNHSKLEEGSFSTGINYFSNIIQIGKWQLRQFIKPQFTIGFNRLKSDNLSLSNDSGIRGFNSNALNGTQRMIFTFQLQSYSPWKFIGFRFGPYIVCSLGMLGTEKSGFHRSPLYSSFGIGVLLKNEYLILNTFQVSIAYYPFMPGAKNNDVKLNPIKTTDFGFRDFDISEPSQISFQ
jgi:hypothetical protein